MIHVCARLVFMCGEDLTTIEPNICPGLVSLRCEVPISHHIVQLGFISSKVWGHAVCKESVIFLKIEKFGRNVGVGFRRLG